MGRIPAGEIILKPNLQADYDKLALEFSGAINRMNDQKIGKVGIIYLGRTGDILNCLPIARFIAERYEKPLFFVSKQFASVLDGVSVRSAGDIGTATREHQGSLEIRRSQSGIADKLPSLGQRFSG